MQASNKGRIAKNTLFLYFRMLFVMAVSLYTSRVVLEILGIDDYGIYQSVGGIVGMLTFINSALSTGTSRFITFELGRNNPEKLHQTFSTIFSLQLILIGIIILVAETVGVWFVNNKLQIPTGAHTAALGAYHLSIFTTAVSLLSVPYLAAIIAHERMNVFAYIGIFEVSAKLGVVYLLTVGNFNRLIFYASLLLIVQLLLTGFYIFYCLKHFKECHYQPILNKKIFKDIFGFSGWSLFAASSTALNNQGVLVLLNMFFSPAVVTARAISLQVNNAANQFVSNFRTAVNPQIVKQYAAGNEAESRSLLLSSTKYSFYMMYMLSLPICIGARPLLEVWLKVVPDYTVIFLQIVIVQSLFQVFDTSFYTALYAKGDLKLNALISPSVGFMMFPIVYLLFKHGASPVALSWASLIMYAIVGLIIKPWLIVKIAGYNWKEIIGVFRPCLIVSLIATSIAYLISRALCQGALLRLALIVMICLCTSCVVIYYFGLSRPVRKKLTNIVIDKVRWM